ncbi:MULTISPECIES: methylated-DNA--[protein]-cysteine S-methyltransferase [unclassified Paenibacillus]|uniref:methylated-DNA--[protein]-cysteine S-methyltransferase n=1 Tax=unclassified Paenibacillus TaxID=185978 RepID=UPI002406EBA4|nr:MULTISPECIES: methylated-DNA--[protein]-cysteine S-methyltransferase [unclassified Paenibacillus]MDF9840838.1 O-6-methylguanine DNA methyltransferase [Paenibacillus sp. PastF-2]MDF9847422.1 O-6-methylguanine DNA methyltransferase [Paenibacillus sp. PastM-2]MDF9854001.1 O-6-methylguanine DNA methyltransferase [Paenibacillus sp. PastF-1]MDH6479273.1 O-6-methylguanine DNA methyltransferase [Paenibacillus sp. PastH-2]MDH6506991.1 O-6-methylguanine DNA methyltransferase [Paenibacillus sp. PastM-
MSRITSKPEMAGNRRSAAALPVTIYHHTVNLGGRAWTLWASAKGLIRVSYEQDQGQLPAGWLNLHAPSAQLEENAGVFAEMGVINLLERYFAGEAVSFGSLPLDLWGTAFQQEVWKGLMQIPHGQLATYKELAVQIGRPLAVRAVGAANGQNPIPVIVPCHRVIGANGTLTGYRGGLKLKQELLALEGITHVGAQGHERFAF